jgi:hypothetical protein
MKKIILAIVFITSFSCNAQSRIFPLYKTSPLDATNGVYFKDLDDFHNQFVGTWLLNNGTTYLKVTFKKKPKFFRNILNKSYYVDYLVGEYEYKENGITKVNTLSNINIDYLRINKYNLRSLFKIKKSTYPPCPTCGDNEGRLKMDFQEIPNRDPSWAANASFILRHVVEGGVEKLNVQFLMRDPAGAIPDALSGDDAYHGFSLPFGDYVLTKQ